MPINIKHRIRTIIETDNISFICDCCGKEDKCGDRGRWPNAGYNPFEISGGYFSKFPGDLQSFDAIVCDDCLESWTKTW